MDTSEKQIFIDKFLIPAKAIDEFKERTKINISFITKQPGFIKDEAFERIDEQGNLIYITIVVWEDEDAIKKQKQPSRLNIKGKALIPWR